MIEEAPGAGYPTPRSRERKPAGGKLAVRAKVKTTSTPVLSLGGRTEVKAVFALEIYKEIIA